MLFKIAWHLYVGFSLLFFFCCRSDLPSLNLFPFSSSFMCFLSLFFQLFIAFMHSKTTDQTIRSGIVLSNSFFSVLFELIKINAIISMEINFTIYFIYKSCYFSFFAALAEAGWGHIFGKKNVKQKSTKKVLNSHWENGDFFFFSWQRRSGASENENIQWNHLHSFTCTKHESLCVALPSHHTFAPAEACNIIHI